METMIEMVAEISDTAGANAPLWVTMVLGFVGMWVKLTHKNRRDRALDREEIRFERVFWREVRGIIDERMELIRGALYEEFNRRTSELEQESPYLQYRRKNNDKRIDFEHARDNFDNEIKDINDFYTRKIIERYQSRQMGRVTPEKRRELIERYAELMRRGYAQRASREIGVHPAIQGTIDTILPYERFLEIYSEVVQEIKEHEGRHNELISGLEAESVIVNYKPRRK